MGCARRSAVHAGLRAAYQTPPASGRRPALLADWLPCAGLVAPGVVLIKDGSFQRSVQFRGPDLDSATQG
ncbi:hypothetical protein G6F55_014676 [Rhizopus delemar]|nr:hypothetical protein G6F55_014676 [Rhizopus delemar]